MLAVMSDVMQVMQDSLEAFDELNDICLVDAHMLNVLLRFSNRMRITNTKAHYICWLQH